MTVGTGTRFDTTVFVEGARALGVSPHVTAKAKAGAIDGRTTRHAD